MRTQISTKVLATPKTDYGLYETQAGKHLFLRCIFVLLNVQTGNRMSLPSTSFEPFGTESNCCVRDW